MLLIPCPWCGPREDDEFSFGGEADIQRPADPGRSATRPGPTTSSCATNRRGLHREQWCHTAGCRRWFIVERDTNTNQILAVSMFGNPP